MTSCQGTLPFIKYIPLAAIYCGLRSLGHKRTPLVKTRYLRVILLVL